MTGEEAQHSTLEKEKVCQAISQAILSHRSCQAYNSSYHPTAYKWDQRPIGQIKGPAFNLREFGRTTVILTTGAGNVGSEPRSMIHLTGSGTGTRKCIVLIYTHIYIYVHMCVQN